MKVTKKSVLFPFSSF